MIKPRYLRSLLLCFALLTAGCSGLPFLIPNPPQSEPQISTDGRKDEEVGDFGDVFDSDTLVSSPPDTNNPPDIDGPKLIAERNIVRIALKRAVSGASFSCSSPVKLSGRDISRKLHGSIKISGVNDFACMVSSASGHFTVGLPCTLKTGSINNFINFEGRSYRGNICLLPASGRSLTIVNVLPVEHYLRGVVPLEIGRRPESEIEAVKAQAVAARTYSYKRMMERRSQQWDMLPTVSDQVYGGAGVEDAVSDKAIARTRGMVLAYKDSLVHGYYHSTCGGKTANIEDVWGKEPIPYLVSIDDVDENGEAYCRSSRYFTWMEKWSTAKLSSILHRYSGGAFPGRDVFSGTLSGMRIENRFPCGRIQICAFSGSRGTFRYGTDKIRFALRRDVQNAPILRSANFTFQNISSREVVIHGRGYGHGVGMCQVGAMGRARKGQSFEQILSAYYRGTRLVNIVHGGN